MKDRLLYRYLVLDRIDEAMMCLAIKDAFPTALFSVGGAGLRKPELAFVDTIMGRGSVADIWIPDAGWRPELRIPEGGPALYVITNVPKNVINYSRSNWFWGAGKQGVDDARWSFVLPTLENGNFGTNYDSKDEDSKRVVNAVWRILGRLTTNKNKSPSFNEYVSVKTAKGGIYRAGNHVMEWVRGAPRRMVMGSRVPCDDWQPPDTPWHRDLRRRVIERHGAEYGVPDYPNRY
jgi:hypothetical protein